MKFKVNHRRQPVALPFTERSVHRTECTSVCVSNGVNPMFDVYSISWKVSSVTFKAWSLSTLVINLISIGEPAVMLHAPRNMTYSIVANLSWGHVEGKRELASSTKVHSNNDMLKPACAFSGHMLCYLSIFTFSYTTPLSIKKKRKYFFSVIHILYISKFV